MKRKHSRIVAFIVFAIVALIGVFLDRLTKSLAVIHLSGGQVQPFIPGVMDFRLIYNSGAAWGIFDGATFFFLAMMVVAVIAIIAYLAFFKKHTALQVIGLGMIAAGAIGNGIDRAMTGEVVDFLHTLFIVFPSFNIADSCITVGVILFIVVLFFGEQEQWGKKVAKDTVPTAEDKSSVSVDTADATTAQVKIRDLGSDPESDDARL